MTIVGNGSEMNIGFQIFGEILLGCQHFASYKIAQYKNVKLAQKL